MGPSGQPFEIQIRTEEMHKTAEYGIAAHWKYKEGGDSAKSMESQEAKLNWSASDFGMAKRHVG